MVAIFRIAWERFRLISLIIGEVQSRVLLTVFYFTILLPFGLGSRLFSDPLRLDAPAEWLERDPTPDDLDSAREQG